MKTKLLLYLSITFILFTPSLFANQEYYTMDDLLALPGRHFENNGTLTFTECLENGPLRDFDATMIFLYPKDTYHNAKTGEMTFNMGRYYKCGKPQSCPIAYPRVYNPDTDSYERDPVGTVRTCTPDIIGLSPGSYFLNEGKIIKGSTCIKDWYMLYNHGLNTTPQDQVLMSNNTPATFENRGSDATFATNSSLYLFSGYGDTRIINEGEISYKFTNRLITYSMLTPALILRPNNILDIQNTGVISINEGPIYDEEELEGILVDVWPYFATYNNKDFFPDHPYVIYQYAGIDARNTCGTNITNEGNFTIANAYMGIYVYSAYNQDECQRSWGKQTGYNLTIENKAGGNFNLMLDSNVYQDEGEDYNRYTDGFIFFGDKPLDQQEGYPEYKMVTYNSGILIRASTMHLINEGNFTIDSYNAGIQFFDYIYDQELYPYSGWGYSYQCRFDEASRSYIDCEEEPQAIINNSGIFNFNSSSNDTNSSIILSDGNDIFTNTGVLNLSHGIDGGAGIDAFNLGSDRIDAFNKNIINFENISKYDTGTWNLDGNISGAQNINVLEGELNLNGYLHVNAPLAVIGNVNLNGSLVIDITDTDAGSIHFLEKEDINNANLIIQLPTADTTLSSEWKKTILTAPNLEQRFNSYSTNSEFYDFLFDYYPNRITVTTKNVNLLSLCAAINPSENIASLIDKFEKGINTNPTNQLVIRMYSVKKQEQICQALQSLSPETLVSAAAGARANLSAHIKNISARLGYFHAPEKPQKNLASLTSDYFGTQSLNNTNGAPDSLWIRQTYGKISQDADSLHIGFNTNGIGISIGKDYLLGKMLFGISGGYSNTAILYDESFAEGDITTYNISGYGSYAAYKYYIDAILTYSNHNYDFNRRIIMDDFIETAKAEWQASQYSAYIEAGYKIPFKKNLLLTPVINLEYADYSQDPFIETGSIGNLDVSEANYKSLISGIGFTLEKEIDYKGWILTPYASLMLKHNFEDVTDDIRAELLSLPKNLRSITASGYDQGTNNYTVGLGLRAYTKENLQIYFNYDMIIRKNALSHQLGFGLKFYF